MRNISELDPLPIDLMEKYGHHLKTGDRVVLKETGHHGKVSNLDNHNRVHVELDNGHFVHCRPEEVEPETFWSGRATPASGKAGTGELSKGDYDFLPVDAPSLAAGTYSATTEQLLEPFLKMSGGLMRALRSSAVSVHDRLLCKAAIDNIEAGRIVVDPFCETEDENLANLRIIASRYENGGDQLSKGARLRPDEDPEFKVGQRVKCKVTKKMGTIQRLSYGVAHVNHDDGTHGVIVGDQLEAA